VGTWQQAVACEPRPASVPTSIRQPSPVPSLYSHELYVMAIHGTFRMQDCPEVARAVPIAQPPPVAAKICRRRTVS